MITWNVMKAISCLILLIFSNYLASEEIKAEDWLLWYKVETQLPFSSALTIYPPVNLYAMSGELRGSIATPYSLSSGNAGSDFLITVTDAKGKTHFLKPKLKSVGFVSDLGISISTLKASSFQDGRVLVQLYKINSQDNRQELRERENKNVKKQQGVENVLSQFNIPKPVINKVWDLKSSTLDGQLFDKIVASSTYTIIQLYSQYCGFCKKSIPLNNSLNNNKDISILGLVGTEQIKDFKEHLNTNNVQYPFIAYEDKYAESALLKALDQQGFPTYFVLDEKKKVRAIHVGTPALVSWLETQSF